MMAGTLRLQYYDDVSDAETVERICFDLRWKVALNLPLDYDGFDSSSLSVFRTRLVEHKVRSMVQENPHPRKYKTSEFFKNSEVSIRARWN